MSEPRFTMRESRYRSIGGRSYFYAMILDRWYCYREVWRETTPIGRGVGAHTRENALHEIAVAKLEQLERENEAWLAAV